MIRAVGGATDEGQTLTIRPCLSKVSDPHSDGGSEPDVCTRLLPSGPERW